MTFPNLAKTFRAVAEEGHAGFYKGRIAQAIVDLVQAGGGVMTMEDLANQEAQVVEPICYEFKKGAAGADGVTLWEVSVWRGFLVSRLTFESVPSEWTRAYGACRTRYHRAT
jgi:gamma-glutamyltranspeptidase